MVRSFRDFVPLLLFLALAAAAVGSLGIGRYPVPFGDVVSIILTTNPFGASGSYDDRAWVAVEVVRLPRTLLVILCGMGLGLCGAVLQGIFRNPLVSPEIAGVSSGASLGGVVALALGWSMPAVVALAFAGGSGAFAVVFVLAQVSGGASTLVLVLAGVIVSGFCASLVSLVQLLVDPVARLPSILFWLMGSFVGATFAKVAVVAVVALVAGSALMALRWRINLLSLGEVDAQALGVRVDVLRWTMIALVALIIAAQVAVSGGVAWVGLVIPHFARLLVGPDHARLLPASALMGGLYLLVMDLLARSLGAQEIPIGLITSVVGAPIFAFLFWRVQARGWMG